MRFSKFVLSLFFVCSFLVYFSGNVDAYYYTGDRGSEVEEIQARLQKLGYEINVDGVYGNGTAQIVKAFQLSAGIAPDGVVGEVTFRKLMEREMPASRSGSVALIRRVISNSLTYQGVPYVFGGNTPGGFDCSGFTRYVFAQAGINLPRMADDQYYAGRQVSQDNLQPGDLVYFTTYTSGISHVGIYLGDGNFISATSSAGVAVRSIHDSYWGPRYVGANRVM